MTDRRLKRVADHIRNDDVFCFTYGDGVDKAEAEALLGWRPTWTFDRTIDVAVDWYRDLRDAASPSVVAARTLQDIRAYEADARGRGVAWAVSRPSRRPRSVHV
jgi:dTDP-D-glucose 4,6-dehydratase